MVGVGESRGRLGVDWVLGIMLWVEIVGWFFCFFDLVEIGIRLLVVLRNKLLWIVGGLGIVFFLVCWCFFLVGGFVLVVLLVFLIGKFWGVMLVFLKGMVWGLKGIGFF